MEKSISKKEQVAKPDSKPIVDMNIEELEARYDGTVQADCAALAILTALFGTMSAITSVTMGGTLATIVVIMATLFATAMVWLTVSTYDNSATCHSRSIARIDAYVAWLDALELVYIEHGADCAWFTEARDTELALRRYHAFALAKSKVKLKTVKSN